MPNTKIPNTSYSWIALKDRKPKAGKVVLVHAPNENMKMRYLGKDGSWHSAGGGPDSFEPEFAYWRPLP